MNETLIAICIMVLAFAAMAMDYDHGDSWKMVVSYTLGYLTKRNLLQNKKE